MKAKLAFGLLSAVVFLFISCNFFRHNKLKTGYVDYLPHEPVCVPGIYYYRCQSGDTVLVDLKPDHSYIHHVKIGNKRYDNLGRWSYVGPDNSPCINFSDWHYYKEEGGDEITYNNFFGALIGCSGVLFDEDKSYVFDKK